jgi:general L-amino acid transport system permease protein
MSIEARQPPSRFVAKLRRALGGRAGWGGFALQVLFVAALAWIGYEIVGNARLHLASQHIASGFGFLSNTAGFGISQSLIPYSESDTYTRVFLVGLLNTLLVSVIGIFFATIIGFVVGLGRLSPNWLLAKIAGGYVELVRNLPLLFQILFWYLAVLGSLPNPRQSISLFGSFFLSNRGFVIPKPIGESGLMAFAMAIVVAIMASLLLRTYARRQLFESGRLVRIWPYVLGLLIGIRRPDAGAVDLYRGLHCRDRARRSSVGSQGTDGGRRVAGSDARFDLAIDRGAAGAARHFAAAHQPVSQSHQEFVAGGGHRISRSVLGVRRNRAEPDRTGD